MHRRKIWKFLKANAMPGCVLAYLFYLIFLFSLPAKLFQEPLSTVLEARDGRLLSAQIAEDEQWRLPPADSLSDKFVKCLLQYEDKRFYYHPGVDPVALLRAAWLNLKHQRIVSGGSTISMQVIRLSRKNKPRTLSEKLIEIILASRLELKYSKSDILKLYANNAPFGGNVVGLESASWRYYNKPSPLLSWGEAATLAVLPNSPAMIHPGRNRDVLRRKRNELLEVLFRRKIIDEAEKQLAQSEPIPETPVPLPSNAPHLLSYFQQNGRSGRLKTSIDFNLQKQLNDLAVAHWSHLKFQGINNLAILVLDIESNQVLAYVGNSPLAGSEHGQYVDIIQAPRSSGSILKPFLYASALSNGEILLQSLLTDIPISIAGYKPENYLQSYDGVVPADKALSRSLNVPFVKLLQEHGVARFYSTLQRLGFTSLNRPPDHYGLSLILGGAECTLWDVTNAYAGMARTLNGYYELSQNQRITAPYVKAELLHGERRGQSPKLLNTDKLPLSPDAIHFTFQAMAQVVRPGAEGDWQRFEASRRIAWKTGTSFGFRDAWAVGVDTKYAVGVWVGNADGEGRTGLVGVYTAAPLLFDVFKKLPATNKWFEEPYEEMQEAVVCQQSGYLANQYCPKDTVFSIKKALRSSVCSFHKLVHLTPDGRYSLSMQCRKNRELQSRSWFILPPAEEYYYRKKHPEYQPPPPLHPDCISSGSQSGTPLELIYPATSTLLVPPKDLSGELNTIILKASHRDPNATVFWHLDNKFLGSTKGIHTMQIEPIAGKHQIVVVDESGNTAERWVEIKLE